MTTTVKVNACCSSTVAVSVKIETDTTGENHVLEDGESGEYTIYDDRVITVREFDKPVDA